MTSSAPSFPSHPSSVPLFHSLGNGTVEQDHVLRNTQWNTAGTSSLKALANKVFEGNTKRNNPETGASKSVPLPDQTVPLRGTNSGADDATQYDALSYEFEERLTTRQGCFGVPRGRAQGIAVLNKDRELQIISAILISDD